MFLLKNLNLFWLPACVILANSSQLKAADREAEVKADLPKLQNEYRANKLQPLGPETPLSRVYFDRLNRGVRFVQKDMKDWPGAPGAKFHRLDISTEQGVRQNGGVALSLAVVAGYGDFDQTKAGLSRAQVQANAAALVKYLAITHVSNLRPTGDGKPWGDAWQSAYWAGFVGLAGWLIWDELPDETKMLVARTIIHEANRFNTRPPDNGEAGDTKSEENAWNSEAIALAACMFQQHPNAALWRKRAMLYMVNSYSTSADHLDTRMLDGLPIKDWVVTTNIHSDFTLENHHRVHPDYLSCFTLNLQNAKLYKLAGLEIPEATFHHAKDCNDVLKFLTATNGSLFYINGQDWWPHRHEVPLTAQCLAGMHFQDPDAACIERGALASLGRMHERFDDGRAVDPRQASNANANEELMKGYAKNYLTHRLFGDGPQASSFQEFQKHQSGTRIFEKGGFVVHRTPGKFVSFCWVNEVMGLIYPSEDTWFISPQERGFVGTIEIEGAKDSPPILKSHTVTELQPGEGEDKGGFAFVGKLTRCEGNIEQRIAVISLPDAPVVYVEQLRARRNVKIKEIATGTVSILNEDAAPIVPNECRVWTAEGEQKIKGFTDAFPERLIWKTSWVNLDDKLGIAAEGTGRMMFLANHKYRRARITQTLAANYSAEIGPKKAGDIISEAVVTLIPNAKHSARSEPGVIRSGKDVFLVGIGNWQVSVNLGETDVQTRSPGEQINLSPFKVAVKRVP